jgi:two-component system, NtrC family, nitrogen regulation response regulator NtrX
MANDILIVDDEADIRDLVAGILDDEGFSTRTARDSDSALAEIANRRPHLVFLDIWLQGSKLDGLQLLEQIKRDHAEVPVVMISGHGNIETAVAAIKRGAYDFIEKPFKADRLILVATRALETSRLKREVKELKQLAPAASVLTGRSACMNQLRQTIDRAAKANSRILIVGPSGAGKELAARTLHSASSRAEGPFVVINAAAITPESMEIELFGVEQSNGEQPRKAGALEEAHGGTLFIDEIGDMPRETQNKILRVLVDQTFQRAGGTTKVNVDVRIVSSTARNLEEEIAEGRFREDLYYRLSVIPIHLPALRERREDIPLLARSFLDRYSKSMNKKIEAIEPEAMRRLEVYDWPGNVRELENTIERAVALEASPRISAEALPARIRDHYQDAVSNHSANGNGNGSGSGSILPAEGLDLEVYIQKLERSFLLAAMERSGGVRTRAADTLKMSYRSFRHYAKKYGI